MPEPSAPVASGTTPPEHFGEPTAKEEPTPEERRAEIEKQLQRLKKREASIRNPYLPRVEPTEEEKKREEGKDNATRIKMIRERIKKLEAELQALKKPES